MTQPTKAPEMMSRERYRTHAPSLRSVATLVVAALCAASVRAADPLPIEPITDAVSRIVSVFKETDRTVVLRDAVSRTLTVHNALAPVAPPLSEVFSREISLINDLNRLPVPITDISSRIVSVHNDLELPTAAYLDTVSRVQTVFNDLEPKAPNLVDVLSREIAVLSQPYTLAEGVEALRLGAGLQTVGAEQMDRLDVVKTPPSNGRIDIEDAVRVCRMALGIDNQ